MPVLIETPYVEPSVLPEAAPLTHQEMTALASGVFGYRVLQAAAKLSNPTICKQAAISEAWELDNAVEATKQEVQAMTPAAQAGYDAVINEQLRRDTGMPIKRVAASWCSWLVEAASPAEIIDFASANARRVLAKQQHPELQAQTRVQETILKSAVKEQMRIGRFHPEAEMALPLINRSSLRLSDYTDMAARRRAGYVRRTDRDYLYIAEHETPYLPVSTRKNIRHELGHVAIGEFSETTEDESAVEHIAVSSETNGWQSFDPFHQQRVGTYIGCRLVTAAYGIDPALWLRAFTARSPEARYEAGYLLDKALGARKTTVRQAIAKTSEDIKRFCADQKLIYPLVADAWCHTLVTRTGSVRFAPTLATNDGQRIHGEVQAKGQAIMRYAIDKPELFS